MKIITQPATPEKSYIVSDFNRAEKSFTTIEIDSGYGSELDGCIYRFDSDDVFTKKLLDFIKENLHTGDLENHVSRYIDNQ